MDSTAVLCLVLVAYIAWRERTHAVERQLLLSRRGGVPLPAPASSRRGAPGKPPQVISTEDDAAFSEWKDRQPFEGIAEFADDGEIE